MAITSFPHPASSEPDMADLKDSAALLGSRICHDLISPLGAISNGLELLSMSGVANSPELQLIEESVANANARIKFFRVAFGAASSSQIMARTEILRLMSDCYGGGRLTVRWHPPFDPSRSAAKLAFLAMMCAEAALPQGGEIVVESERDNWAVQGYGPQIRFDAPLWANLAGSASASEVGSGQVQFLLLRDGLKETGQTPQVGHSDSAVSLRYGPA